MDRRTFIATSGTALAAIAPAAAMAQSQGKGESRDRIFVLIEIQAVPGMEDKIRQTFVHTIQTSHKPGILSAQIFEHSGEPGRFYSLQEWESEAAFREHMSGSREGLDSHMAMLKGHPSLTILKHLG